MVDYVKFMEGVAKFIDKEITPKVPGWQGWLFGVGSGIAMQKAGKILDELKNNKILKTLDIIDDNNNINVDIIYEELTKQADKSPITIDIPMMGSLTLNRRDVDLLYNYINS